MKFIYEFLGNSSQIHGFDQISLSFQLCKIQCTCRHIEGFGWSDVKPINVYVSHSIRVFFKATVRLALCLNCWLFFPCLSSRSYSSSCIILVDFSLCVFLRLRDCQKMGFTLSTDDMHLLG